MAKSFCVKPRYTANDTNLAEAINLPFVDCEGEGKSFCGGVVIDVCAGHAGVCVTVAAVVQPDLLAIAVDPVGIVDVAAGQETDDRTCGGLDNCLELAVAK